MFDFILVPFGYVIRFFYGLTDNYLFSILLFALVMEIILTPLAIKQHKNQIKQAKLQPKVMAIRKKYAGRNDQATQQKMQQETMEMYQRENFNPAGGCGTLIIQLPIIMCLYSVITQPLRYITNLPAAQITALKDFITGSTESGGLGAVINVRNLEIDIINYIRENMSLMDRFIEKAPDLEGAILPNFTVMGLDLSMTPMPSLNPFNWLVVIPIITFFVMIASQKIMQRYSFQSPETQQAQNGCSMKVMMWTMPLMSVAIEFGLAAAIGVYWVFRSILQVVQKIIISKLMPLPKFTEEDYKEAERQANMSNKQRKREGSGKFVRSLHHIDDEEYLERHKEDLAALEEGTKSAPKAEKAPKDGENGDDSGKTEVKESTDSKDAPAPIKNDEKGSYKKK